MRFVHLGVPRTPLRARRTAGILEMPGEHLTPAPVPLGHRPRPAAPGSSAFSPFPSSPSADLGTFPLAEFRSFWAWVAFAFRVRFVGAWLGLVCPGVAPGAVKNGLGSGGAQGSHPTEAKTGLDRSAPSGLLPPAPATLPPGRTSSGRASPSGAPSSSKPRRSKAADMAALNPAHTSQLLPPLAPLVVSAET